MTPTKFSRSILTQISEEKITPRPHWHFVLKNSVFWLIFVISIILGGLGFGMLLTAVFTIGLDVIWHLQGPIQFMIRALPLAWIVFFFIFLTASIWGLHHTKKGYKLSLVVLMMINIGTSIAMGTGLHLSRDTERIEHQMSESIQMYEGMEARKTRLWNDRSHGRIAGKILSMNDDQWTLQSFRGKDVWTLDVTDVEKNEVPTAQVGDEVACGGEKYAENFIKVKVLLPWDPAKRRSFGPKKGRSGARPTGFRSPNNQS